MRTICLHHYSRARPENGREKHFTKASIRPLRCLLCGVIRK